jgi:hypothetical protein
MTLSAPWTGLIFRALGAGKPSGRLIFCDFARLIEAERLPGYELLGWINEPRSGRDRKNPFEE